MILDSSVATFLPACPAFGPVQTNHFPPSPYLSPEDADGMFPLTHWYLSASLHGITTQNSITTITKAAEKHMTIF
jgi:hypothetical protein